MKQWIGLAGVLFVTIALAIVLAGRLRAEPKTAPAPSDSAVAMVVQTFNDEHAKHWRRIGGDLADGYIHLGDYHKYRKGARKRADDPYLATLEIRPQDNDGFLYTADISAGNYPTRRTKPFAGSRNGHLCLDFSSSGEVLKRERDLATYDC